MAKAKEIDELLVGFRAKAAAIVKDEIVDALERLPRIVREHLSKIILSCVGVSVDSWGRVVLNKDKSIIQEIFDSKVKDLVVPMLADMMQEVLSNENILKQVKKSIMSDIQDNLRHSWKEHVFKAIDDAVGNRTKEIIDVMQSTPKALDIPELREKYDLSDPDDFSSALGKLILEHLVSTRFGPKMLALRK